MKPAGFIRHAATTLLITVVHLQSQAGPTNGMMPNPFTVNASGKQVWFSQGNLQHSGANTTGTWSFAANQYDRYGTDQTDDHRDLFGWGTKTTPNNTSTNDDEYTWADWGENKISNGGNLEGVWSTLTAAEWQYLFNRTNYRTMATVHSVPGLIMMPDGWTATDVNPTITVDDYTTNILTDDQWTVLEGQGCVFLPTNGWRDGTNCLRTNEHAIYWTSTTETNTTARDAYIDGIGKNSIWTNENHSRHLGFCVRLVLQYWQGSGTAEDPYLITSTYDWNKLSYLVGNGQSFSDTHFRLTADIGTAQAPITRMVGVYSETESEKRPFSGTFDGNGHTLTVDYSGNDYETRTALFSYVKVATIRNLIIAGNIGSAGRAAGIVGESDESDGLNTITNCVSSITISGGLVGGIALGGNVDIRGCLFNGTINGTSQSGGFVAWGQNVTRITNCFFAPQAGSSISGCTFYYTGSDTGGAAVTNSFYTTVLGAAQGTAATPTANKPSNIGTQTAVYSVSGITAFTNGLCLAGQYFCGSPVYDYTLTTTPATVLGESKYVTTFYHGTLDYQLPAGALAYTAGKDGDKVVFYRIGTNSNVIPKNTAVIIVADSASVTLTKLDSTDVSAKANNLLTGSDTDYTAPSGTAYVLGVYGGVLGFYPITGNTVPAGKAYYVE